MSAANSITGVHVDKLSHKLDEIRLRALDNIISKLDDGFSFYSQKTEKGFILKLFEWFTSQCLPCSPDQILNLICRLISRNRINILNFGVVEFKRKLAELKALLDTSYHNIINEIDAAVSKQLLSSSNQSESSSESGISCDSLEYLHNNQLIIQNDNNQCKNYKVNSEQMNKCINDELKVPNHADQLNDVIEQSDLTLRNLENASYPTSSTSPLPSKKEAAIRWLLFPWQPLVSSDYGVLSAVEEALNTNINANPHVIVRTCQFITNVMLQDFPAEVFLQRPSIVLILQALLQQSSAASLDITPMVLRTLNKLTRSLRFRIYYYCDSHVINGRQRDVGKNAQSSISHSIENRDAGDAAKDADCIPKINYHASYQSGAVASDIVMNDTDLQLQQLLIPNYCTETLGHIFKLLLNVTVDDYVARPLKDIKSMMDLNWELLQLLTISITPSIWMSSDGLSLKIHEDVKTLMDLIGNVLQYLANYNTIDYCRISYLHIITLTLKLLCSLVPLELADLIIPQPLKMSICIAMMDPPIYIIYPELNIILQEYARYFRGRKEVGYLKLFDEVDLITKSMKAAIKLLKRPVSIADLNVGTLKLMYASKSCLSYHKNLSIIKQYVYLSQNLYRMQLKQDEELLSIKLVLYLLAHSDKVVRAATYKECHSLVASTMLGMEGTGELNERKHAGSTYSTISINCLSFLCNTAILTEIICHGINDENESIKKLAVDIMIYLLKGKIPLQEVWLKFIQVLLPILSLLQCHAEIKTSLGQCILKMFDPDISLDIQLPDLEVIKGNARFLFSIDNAVRDEGVFRLIYLLGNEQTGSQKLPRLPSLHGLPLASLLYIHIKDNRQVLTSKFDGKYQSSSLLSVCEVFKIANIEPKIRKSALVQLSVILTDKSLHNLFLSEGGLSFILDIFDKALLERDFENYPDSVIPIITILKLIVLTQSSVRQQLSNRPEILLNILRSVFLFPNNQCIKSDASVLLFLLLFNNQIILINKSEEEMRETNLEISLPNIILQKMQSPFICKTHWKYSINRKSDTSLIHFGNPVASTFLRQFWAWKWNHNESGNLILNSEEAENINNSGIIEKLMIREPEVIYLRNTSVVYCCQQQLFNIQASIAHQQVTCALDYLWMYIKYNSWLEGFLKIEKVTSMPWEKTFQRFLLSNPTNKEDGDLFVDILNFLNILINITHDPSVIGWLSKIIKGIAKSLSDIVEHFDIQNQDIHQSILKLVRTLRCNNFDNKHQVPDELIKSHQGDMWSTLIQLLISNLCYSDQQQHHQHLEHQQHFYNLVYLDWLLTCLISLTSRCQWDCPRDLLASLGNALIELITSFHGNGAVSFMGLSITRNSIICLNHLLHYIKLNLPKPSDWTLYWYQQEGKTLSWIPILAKNRDPLIRASALQLLGGLIKTPHNAQQLLGALLLAPSELVQTLLQFIVNREECSIVKEHACIALGNLIKNSSNPSYEYIDSLASNAILLYIEQMNVYYEINLLCCNIYMASSIDPSEELFNYININDINANANANVDTESDKASLIPLSLPKALLHFYNCHDELLMLSSSSSSLNDKDLAVNLYPQFLSTPSLITSICTLLNCLIIIGEYDSISRIYEHSLDKYFVRCLGPIPKFKSQGLDQHCDILELYRSICIILTNCIIHSKDFAAAVNFSPDIFCLLLSYLNKDLFNHQSSKYQHLRDKLWTAVFSFLSVLSLTENQNTESLRTAIEMVGLNMIVLALYNAINKKETELRMSGVACLAFLLSQEIISQANDEDNEIEAGSDDEEGKLRTSEMMKSQGFIALGAVLDSTVVSSSKSANNDDNPQQLDEIIGSEICKSLIHLLIAHNYANKSNGSIKRSRDKNLIIGALSNLLSISNNAKKAAIDENLTGTSIMILKELYTELNLQPYGNIRPNSRDKKVLSLMSDLNRIMLLLMNFAYNSRMVKCTLSQAGLADMLHKLWAWISLNDSTLLSSLKLIATFTTNCPEGAQSLTLTTSLWPGVGLRKTPNTVSLIHVIIHLITREIEKTETSSFNNQRLQLGFNVLRSAVHVYECRVSITKSNLLEFFIKIHPSSTKRTKPWLFVEVYCLEFLIDFTFYDEGQTSVSKATDAVEVLIELARCNTAATRILALSTLRNLLFNTSNRPRLISSVDFINLLHKTFKTGNLCEIGIAGSMLWSLVANNQKGKLIARTSGLGHSLQEVLGRLALMPEKKQQDVANMLQYVIKILSADA